VYLHAAGLCRHCRCHRQVTFKVSYKVVAPGGYRQVAVVVPRVAQARGLHATSVRAKTQTSVLEIWFYPRPSISGETRSRDRYAQKQFSARAKLVSKAPRSPNRLYTGNKLLAFGTLRAERTACDARTPAPPPGCTARRSARRARTHVRAVAATQRGRTVTRKREPCGQNKLACDARTPAPPPGWTARRSARRKRTRLRTVVPDPTPDVYSLLPVYKHCRMRGTSDITFAPALNCFLIHITHS